MKKRMLLFVAVVMLSYTAFSQSALPPVDKSPLDVCYYPVRYPNLKVQDRATEPLGARVIYSRPKIEGRAIFGGLVEYGKLWRLGANEATEIELYRPATIGGKKIPKGRYTIYAIVNEKAWTFIINKETDVWGSFKYSAEKDVVRVDSPVQELEQPVESLAMTFEKDQDQQQDIINLVVAWEKTRVLLPIAF